MISSLSFVVLEGGKYLFKNISVKSSHVVIEFGGNELSQLFALSLKENGNNLNLMASSEIPLCLNVSQSSRNCTKCSFGSSEGKPENWSKFWMIWMKAGLISKLFPYTGSRRILDWAPCILRRINSYNSQSRGALVTYRGLFSHVRSMLLDSSVVRLWFVLTMF